MYYNTIDDRPGLCIQSYKYQTQYMIMVYGFHLKKRVRYHYKQIGREYKGCVINYAIRQQWKANQNLLSFGKLFDVIEDIMGAI